MADVFAKKMPFICCWHQNARLSEIVHSAFWLLSLSMSKKTLEICELSQFWLQNVLKLSTCSKCLKSFVYLVIVHFVPSTVLMSATANFWQKRGLNSEPYSGTSIYNCLRCRIYLNTSLLLSFLTFPLRVPLKPSLSFSLIWKQLVCFSSKPTPPPRRERERGLAQGIGSNYMHTEDPASHPAIL